MKDPNKVLDPYAIYLAHVLHGTVAAIHYGPFPKTAGTLLAATLGEKHHHNRGSLNGSEFPISRAELMIYIRNRNASPQNPPKARLDSSERGEVDAVITSAPSTFDNDQVRDELNERMRKGSHKDLYDPAALAGYM